MASEIAPPWGIDRRADLRRFLRLTSKLKRGPGFYLLLKRHFPREKYVRAEVSEPILKGAR